jgi:hypothetical protein
MLPNAGIKEMNFPTIEAKCLAVINSPFKISEIFLCISPFYFPELQ